MLQRSQNISLPWILLALCAPPLLLSSIVPSGVSIGAGAVLAVTGISLLIRGRLLAAPVNGVIAFLCFALLPMALAVSPVSDQSWKGFCVLLWSVSLYVVVIIKWEKSLRTDALYQFAIMFLGLGTLTIVVGLLGMRVPYKLPLLGDIGESISSLMPDSLGEVPSTELAGIITLVLPVATALSLGPRAHFRWVSRTIAVILFVSLLLTQSRGGILATTASLCFVLFLSGSKGRILLGSGFLAVMITVFVIGSDRMTDAFLLSGQSSGLSFENILTGRPAIWSRAISMIEDFPLLGSGLGSFPVLVGRFYPFQPLAQTGNPEDAHSLVLQYGVDFGIGGIITILLLLALVGASLFRALRKSGSDTKHRPLIVGLAGSLIGYAFFNATDCIAPGAPAGVFFWAVLGLTVQATEHIAPGMAGRLRPAYIALVLAIPAMLSGVFFFQHIRTGIITLQTVSSILTQSGLKNAHPIRGNTSVELWFAGHASRDRGETRDARRYWTALLYRTDRHVKYLAILDAADTALASSAVRLWPDNAEAHFWFGQALTLHDTSRARWEYERGLALNPDDGLRWRQYGDLLARTEPLRAIEAYEQSCLNGDPGANGCWLAGNTALKLGKHEEAIRLFRLSRFLPARQRADSLHRLLHSLHRQGR